MGLFNFFRNNSNGSSTNDLNKSTEIPKEVFIEEKDPEMAITNIKLNGSIRGIDEIYEFLQADYESKGYQDSLTNPDESYKADNIMLIKQDLEILIQKVTTYYEDKLKVLEFHINSRSRAGLVDLVEELKLRKETLHEHVAKVNSINSDLLDEKGITQRIVLSYKRGFGHGLSALTQSKILDKSI